MMMMMMMMIPSDQRWFRSANLKTVLVEDEHKNYEVLYVSKFQPPGIDMSVKFPKKKTLADGLCLDLFNTILCLMVVFFVAESTSSEPGPVDTAIETHTSIIQPKWIKMTSRNWSALSSHNPVLGEQFTLWWTYKKLWKMVIYSGFSH